MLSTRGVFALLGFVFLTLLTAVSQAQVTSEGVRIERNLEFARIGNNPLLLDLYVPQDAKGPLPVIIGIHGGGWSTGTRKDAMGIWEVGRGYAVAVISYRLSGQASFPTQIQDCKAAVRWLRANAKTYNLNPDAFGVIGHSAGGHLAALLGTSAGVKEFDKGENLEFSSRVQAVCDLSGPTDFLQMEAHALPGATIQHDAVKSPESLLIGGAIQKNPAAVTRANPITFVTKDTPPFLLVHGDRDLIVPLNQSELLYAALQKAGVPSELYVVKGAGHDLAGMEGTGRIDTFFDTYLKKH